MLSQHHTIRLCLVLTKKRADTVIKLYPSVDFVFYGYPFCSSKNIFTSLYLQKAVRRGRRPLREILL